MPSVFHHSTVRKRIVYIAVAFCLCLSYLFVNLFRISVLCNEYYKEKVYEEITTTSALKAKRGTIYDTNMNVLATTQTRWRIFVSPREIFLRQKEDKKEYDLVIADGLASILQIEHDNLLNNLRKSCVLDYTVKKAVEEAEYKEVLKFIQDNGLSDMVFCEAQSYRTYPGGTMFSHVLGFTGSDNQGLYGLEYEYNEELAGKNGTYLYAKDANGKALPGEYESYTVAENGYSIVTTLDSYVQTVLESELEKIRINHQVNNRVCGIVMDVTDGSILAMATSSPFDPNQPYELSSTYAAILESSGLVAGTDAYQAKKKELLEIMWSNKAISEMYEPGSTFKVVTVSTALDLGVATINDRFSCSGYYMVGGWRIRCHKITGHGSGFTLAYGLQMSCNPTMMQLSERIGVSNFYAYVQKFGYLQKTGIDLPSEAGSIFHKEENMGPTELATASFGQRFKVSIIAQLQAIATVANSGVRVTPHVMKQIIDDDGNVVRKFETQQTRVISEEVASLVAEVLEEGVSGNGGAKNAYVDGYKVAAKTGTSQKFDILDANGNSYLRIGSTVAFAPSDEHGIAIIIVVDEPLSTIKYGSFVAAPYVSNVLSSILPYLGYESNAQAQDISVPSVIGLSTNAAKNQLTAEGISFEIVGNGSVILSQYPSANEMMTVPLSKMLLYTTEETEETPEVPDVVGWTASQANLVLSNLGFNIRMMGVAQSALDEEVKVTAQSLPPNTKAHTGMLITLTVLSDTYEE